MREDTRRMDQLVGHYKDCSGDLLSEFFVIIHFRSESSNKLAFLEYDSILVEVNRFQTER